MYKATFDTIQMFMALDAMDRKDQERPLDPPDHGIIDWCRDCGRECESVFCPDCLALRRAEERRKALREVMTSIASNLVECPYCKEIALPLKGGECGECGRESYL